MESGQEAHFCFFTQFPYGLAIRIPGFTQAALVGFPVWERRFLFASLLKRQVHLTAAEALFDSSRATET